MRLAPTCLAMTLVLASTPTFPQDGADAMQAHPYVGMWVTKDGYVRHQLLPDGRYDEARGNRESAYQGRYEIEGDHIEYWDDTGFTADGDFLDGVLHHGGMVLYRRSEN
ncbi:Atu4866 domain-containing protein [Devosia sp. 1566]|uniref:Atu4866 domain-containing protein n=1 Tax=Devosia sp. 1566 TaxID=2499144 RepID=UPI000FD7AC56|nr:Atu4866 domain-containing protein [Devosia sp. 1566]